MLNAISLATAALMALWGFSAIWTPEFAHVWRGTKATIATGAVLGFLTSQSASGASATMMEQIPRSAAMMAIVNARKMANAHAGPT